MAPLVAARHDSVTREPFERPTMFVGAFSTAVEGDTDAVRVTDPPAPVATSVNVVAPEIVTVVEPLVPTAWPFSLTEVALLVDQVTSADVLLCRVAVSEAVGAGCVTVTVAVRVTEPPAPVATSVNVVVADTGTDVDPLAPAAVPLIVTAVALVVDQVTRADVPWRVAVSDAVGAGTVGVTLAVRVTEPPEPLATSVNVVAPEIATEVDPLAPTAAPLIVTEVALVVDHVTSAEVALCSVAVNVAVGVAVRRSIVASFDGALSCADASYARTEKKYCDPRFSVSGAEVCAPAS